MDAIVGDSVRENVGSTEREEMVSVTRRDPLLVVINLEGNDAGSSIIDDVFGTTEVLSGSTTTSLETTAEREVKAKGGLLCKVKVSVNKD